MDPFVRQFGGLAGALFASTIFLVVNAFAQPTEGGPIDLVFKINHRPINLSDDVREALSKQADRIARNCGYDAGDREEQVWRDAIAEPSTIRLIYRSPIQLKLPRREIVVSDVVFSLTDPNFLGSPILHHSGRTTLVFKCDGLDMIKLMCMPELKTYFPPGYQRNCQILNRMP